MCVRVFKLRGGAREGGAGRYYALLLKILNILAARSHNDFFEIMGSTFRSGQRRHSGGWKETYLVIPGRLNERNLVFERPSIEVECAPHLI